MQAHEKVVVGVNNASTGDALLLPLLPPTPTQSLHFFCAYITINIPKLEG
jgi:hypothetical protein